MNRFSCRTCKESYCTTDAKKYSVTKKGTGICKYCHSNRNTDFQIKKRAEANPQDHMVCDTCDRLFSVITKWGRVNFKKCKFCNSNQVEDIV